MNIMPLENFPSWRFLTVTVMNGINMAVMRTCNVGPPTRQAMWGPEILYAALC
jgi:hypothetical protein